MSTITSTQYLFKASVFTATTTATVGSTTATAADGYVVPAGTRGQVVTLTLSNTATTNVTTFCDVSLYSGTTASVAYPIVVKSPLYPGGSLVVEGLARHVLPTGGAVYVTPYATNISAIMTVVELT